MCQSGARGVESIAGIMGGEHSGCDEKTTDVLIESALWDPLNIAKSGRALGGRIANANEVGLGKVAQGGRVDLSDLAAADEGGTHGLPLVA